MCGLATLLLRSASRRPAIAILGVDEGGRDHGRLTLFGMFNNVVELRAHPFIDADAHSDATRIRLGREFP